MRTASPEIRAVIAKALAGTAAAEWAANRWGAASEAALRVTKAGVTGIESTELGTVTGQDAFFGSVASGLPFANGNWRRVQFLRRLIAASSGTAGAWIA